MHNIIVCRLIHLIFKGFSTIKSNASDLHKKVISKNNLLHINSHSKFIEKKPYIKIYNKSITK